MEPDQSLFQCALGDLPIFLFRVEGGHRLFGVDGAYAVVGGVDDDLGPRFRLRGDADDVRTLLLDQLAVVQVLAFGGDVVLPAEGRHHVGP